MKQIYRRTTHKKLGGVASGLADYFGIDPIIVRAIFIFSFFIFFGTTFFLYIILWFMMPKDFEVMSSIGFGNGGFRNQSQENYNNSFNNSHNNSYNIKTKD